MNLNRRSTDCGPEQDARRRRLAAESARLIFSSFTDYNNRFRSITRRARRRFDDREWKLGQRDAVERIELYDRRVERGIVRLVGAMGAAVADESTWQATRDCYARLIAGSPDSEFYKTFFNSLTRMIFRTVGVNPRVEFIGLDLEPTLGMGSAPVRRYAAGDSEAEMAKAMLSQLDTDRPFADRDGSVSYLAGELGRCGPGPVSAELLEPVFYRATRAYLVGRATGCDWSVPVVLAFRNDRNGIVLDAVITGDNEIRMLFGFSRSYFHVDLETVGAAVRFLSSVMPGKAVGEFYTMLGRVRQGKTERYRSLFRHLQVSTDQFVHADGEPGMVMVVFSLSSSDIVFKVIRDRFAEPKHTSREAVIGKYRFVFRHDRVGRLVDAQEFRRLRFPRDLFDNVLLGELLDEAAGSCRLDGDDLIVEHCYIERRLRPLNLYLKEAGPEAARNAVIDYGQAVRDLAQSNVFPGDLLLKNFGVSRHGRVIFYDYDEICLLTECRFRDMPSARCEEDETRGEPWFYVGPHDVFPGQCGDFLGFGGDLRLVFMERHAEILTADYWRRLKACHEKEQYFEVVPYTPPARSQAFAPSLRMT